MTTWFALITNPKCERRAEAGLNEIGVETYLPWGKIWSRPKRATGVVMRLRPAFARYLFIRFPGHDTWQGLPRIDGVEAVIASQGSPLPIPEWQVLSTWARETNGLLDFNAGPKVSRKGEYLVGDEVTITAGPFAGFPGRVKRENGEKIVTIETMLFGRELVAKVPLDQVRKAA